MVRVEAGGLIPHFERSLWHSEIPVINSHGAAKLILSELARRHVKVVLTGEGADEALAGYNVFRHIQLLEELRASPRDAGLAAAMDQLLHQEGSGVAGMNTGVVPIRAYPQYDRVVKLFGVYPYAAARALHSGKAIPYILSRDFRKETRDTDFIDEMARRIGYGRMTGLSPVAAHQYYLFKTDLPAYILNYLGDRVEMANSIEGRVPLLDHKLVEFAFALPVSLKLRNGVGKYILRQAILNKVPAAAQLKKRPFAAPSAGTLGLTGRSEGVAHFLERDTIKNIGLFDPLAVRSVLRMLPFLPAGSRSLGLAESMLTGVVSIHALHEMFCRDFPGSMERFSDPAIKTLLPEGAVHNPARVGEASM